MTSDCIPHQAIIASIGAITPLVRLLHEESHEESTKAQGKAAGTLALIVMGSKDNQTAMGSKDNQTAIVTAGGITGITPLVSLLSCEHGDEVIAPHGL